MNPALAAARAGLARGRIEFRQTFTSLQDVWGYLFPAVAMVATMFFMRGATVPGTEFSLGARTLPGALGMVVAFSGMVGLAQQLTVEREDGTLLRAKAIPHGMTGYLIGKIVQVSGMTLISCLLVLIPGLFLFDDLSVGIGSWLTLAGVLLLGLVATMPLGAIIGSLFSNPRNMGLVILPIMGLVATSGIFFPLTNFPFWLQWIGQAFPVYWLGLGMRSALLPDQLAVAEIGGSWHPVATVLVLLGWAIAGLLVAPVVLRRMARRESGSAVAARREKAMQQVR